MDTQVPRQIQEVTFEHAAQDYLRRLPLEHFWEAIDQATQRKITVASLALVEAKRADVHVFNELLIQDRKPGRRKLVQVCPDNMVVVTREPISANGSYNIPLEPVGPFLVMEYVSKNNPRKDYEDSHKKYERDHHNGRRYLTVKPNDESRYAISELDIELGLVDGWVRFWYQGDLLPLPADLQRSVEEAREQAAQAEQRAAAAEQRATDAEQQAIVASQRATDAEQRATMAERDVSELARQLSELRAQLGNGNKRRT